MREIKFRAYEFDAKHMHYFTLWDLFLHKSILPALEASSEIMLSTGLKDANGKEIYEGDIILLKERNDVYLIDSIWPLRRFSQGMALGYFAYGGFIAFRTYFDVPAWIVASELYEIIGNKYENPEFLKETTDESSK